MFSRSGCSTKASRLQHVLAERIPAGAIDVTDKRKIRDRECAVVWTRLPEGLGMVQALLAPIGWNLLSQCDVRVEGEGLVESENAFA
jgi:hypothetical protein